MSIEVDKSMSASLKPNCMKPYEEWNSIFFCIFMDYRGHHRKGAAIYNATWVNLQQKPWFRWTKNMYFWTLQGFKQLKIYQLTLFLSLPISSGDLFRAAPYRLLIVLQKDLLFKLKMFWFYSKTIILEGHGQRSWSRQHRRNIRRSSANLTKLFTAVIY